MSFQGRMSDCLGYVKRLEPLSENQLLVFALAMWPLEVDGYLDSYIEDQGIQPGENEWRAFLTHFAPWLADDEQYQRFHRLFFDAMGEKGGARE